jgi:hypothetical protein
VKKKYVRITFTDLNDKRHTWFAVELSARCFRKVDAEGQWGTETKDATQDHYFHGLPDKKRDCYMNMKYGVLKVCNKSNPFHYEPIE